MFEGARNIEIFHEQEAKKGIRWWDANKKLTMVKAVTYPYGDWLLFQDPDGNLWEQYNSIGD